MWDNTVITDAGVELIKNTMSGNNITITAVKSGTGKVSTDLLRKQTAVTGVKQSGTVQSIKNDGNTIAVSVLFENTGLEKGYTMNQIGIYAKSGQTEILFAIAQDAVGKEIPNESSMPYYSLISNFNFSFSSDLNITSEVDPIGYVTLESFSEHKNNTSNPHNVTKAQIGLDNVENVKVNDHAVTFSDTNTLQTISSGEKASSAFSKIKLAITKLINHLNSKENPHEVTKKQIGLENVEDKSSDMIREELTSENVEKALGYIAANEKNESTIPYGNTKYKMILVGTTVRTKTDGYAYTGQISYSNENIKKTVEKNGCKWNYNTKILAFSEDSGGLKIDTSAITNESSSNYGQVQFRVYNADGTFHSDQSSDYANTAITMIIFAEQEG